MGAAPGRAFAVGPGLQGGFPAGGIGLQVLGEIHRFDAAFFQLVQESVRQRHFREFMVMAESLAVYGQADQLRPAVAGPVAALHPVGEDRGILQQVLEGRRFRQRAVVEKDGQAAPGPGRAVRAGVQPGVRARSVEFPPRGVLPAAGIPGLVDPAQGADPLRLVGREDHILHAQVYQQAHRVVGGGGLGQPHSLRHEAETAFEILYAPERLRQLVREGGQRHDHVVVGLGYGV